jgi:hypothetical protein
MAKHPPALMQQPVSIGRRKTKSTYLYSTPNSEREVFYVNVPNCLPGNKSLNIKINIEHWYSDNKSGTKLHGENTIPVWNRDFTTNLMHKFSLFN